MKVPSPRARKIAGLSAAPVAVLLAGVLVWQGSTAAFTATTRNSGNSWASGQVALTDNDQGRAAFTVENIVPGDEGQNCITVTSDSTVPGGVRSYTGGFSPSATGLEDRITLDIARGTGGGFGDCTGFQAAENEQLPPVPMSEAAERFTDYASGGSTWETTGTPGESATYRIRWEFDTAGMTQQQINALQGSKTSIDLVWELQTDEPGT